MGEVTTNSNELKKENQPMKTRRVQVDTTRVFAMCDNPDCGTMYFENKKRRSRLADSNIKYEFLHKCCKCGGKEWLIDIYPLISYGAK